MADTRLPFSDVTGLAAARAALDPNRMSWRNDVLLSSVIEVLSSKGALSERELLDQVRALWVTTAVNLQMLRATLSDGLKANLLEQRQNAQRTPKWAASEACSADAKLDREWADRMLSAFQREVSGRLEEVSDVPVDESRVPRLTKTLIGSIIAGSHQVYEGVASAGTESQQGRINYDQAATDRYITQRVQPSSVADSICALAVAALDPGDEFGSDLVSVVIRGQVLHGLVTREDLGATSLVGNALMLVDTSALFYLLDSGEGSQRQLLSDFLKEASEDGVDLAVTTAVLDEWERVWQAAEVEHTLLTHDREAPPTLAGRLIDNVVVRSWFQADEFGDGPEWSSYSAKHRNVERWLTQRGVRIIAADTHNEALASQYLVHLEALSAASARRLRTHAGAATDAMSAALVRSARLTDDQSPLPIAWFIAQERLTGRAHRELFPDDAYPLTLSIEAALLLLSATRNVDPSQRRQFAEIVGNSLRMNSFFALSTGYGAEDINNIVDALNVEQEPGETLDVSVRADFLTLAAGAPDVASDLLRRRAARRDRQARRRANELERKETTVARKVDDAQAMLREAEESRDAAQARSARLLRVVWLIAVIVVLAAGVFVANAFSTPTGVIVVASIFVAAVAAEGVAWCYDLGVRTAVFVASIVAAVLWTAVGTAVGKAMDTGTDQRPQSPVSTSGTPGP